MEILELFIYNEIFKCNNMLNPFRFKQFNLSRQQCICAMLMEDAGIACINYNKLLQYLIKCIIEYVDTYGESDVEFELNEMLINDGYKHIDISDKIILKCIFKLEYTEATYVLLETKYENNNVEQIVLLLIFKKNVTIRSQIRLIFQLLYHELNHAIDDIERIKAGKPSLYEILYDKNRSVNYGLLTSNVNNDNLAYIIYRLFVDTELNALVPQIYADMCIEKPITTTFMYSIKKSEPYQIYEYCKEYFEKNIKDKNNWILSAKQYFPKMKNKSDASFLKWFNTLYTERLKTLWYKLWKAGYHYFNDHL